MTLTHSQSRAIDITQKVVSSLSVAGEFLVIITFLASSRFRKPINRLVFYAAFGNFFTNVGTMIGQSAIRLGLNSPLCQFQAFIMQCLLPADALWILCMAINVWLTFFHHWDATRLKSLEWKYMLFCYGFPFIPAFVFFFIHDEQRGKVYGSAVIWCWISIKWDWMRLALFYGPVWVILFLTCAVYIRVGFVVWKWNHRIRTYGKRSDARLRRRDTDIYTSRNGITRTDEVTVTSEDAAAYEANNPARSSNPALRPHHLRNQARAMFVKRSWTRASRGASRANQTNKATVRYYKCALMFFIALAVVWIPSSINRIYNLVCPNKVVFGLEYAAAMVLPLQGFCNAFVYFATSAYACKCMRRDITAKLGFRRSSRTLPPPRVVSTARINGTTATNVTADTVATLRDTRWYPSPPPPRQERESTGSESDTLGGTDADSQRSDTVAGTDTDSRKSVATS